MNYVHRISNDLKETLATDNFCFFGEEGGRVLLNKLVFLRSLARVFFSQVKLIFVHGISLY
jgi:hypothetical protein